MSVQTMGDLALMDLQKYCGILPLFYPCKAYFQPWPRRCKSQYSPRGYDAHHANWNIPGLIPAGECIAFIPVAFFTLISWPISLQKLLKKNLYFFFFLKREKRKQEIALQKSRNLLQRHEEVLQSLSTTELWQVSFSTLECPINLG